MTADTRKCSQYPGADYNYWWMCSPGNYDPNTKRAACVGGAEGDVQGFGNVTASCGVRPALKLDLSKVTFDSTSKTFSLPTPYPLWVGGTQVTSANASNIDGNNKASYDVTSNTLRLDGYTYSGDGYSLAIVHTSER